MLWKTVGDISGEPSVRKERKGKERKGKERKGFMLGSSRGRIRPGNCSVGRLFGDPRFTEAILKFLTDTGVGKMKKGVIVRGEAVE